MITASPQKFVAYWLGYDANPPAIQSLPSGIDVVNLFLLNLTSSPAGTTIDYNYITSKGTTWTEILAQSHAAQANGVKVCVSLIPPDATLIWNTIPDPETFAQNVYSLVTAWGLDGVDIDPEQGGVVPNQTFLAVVQALSKYFGPTANTGLILSFVSYQLANDQVLLQATSSLFNYVMLMGYFWDYPTMISNFGQYAAVVGAQNLLIGVQPGMTPLDETTQLAAYQPASGTKGGMMEFSIGTDPSYQYANAIMLTTGTVQISLPKDQYAHTDAITEWWWHVGTLETASGRKFGFEVNALGVSYDGVSFGEIEIAISDVKNQVHYQIDESLKPLPANWAVYDPSQPWSVSLASPAGTPQPAQIAMTAIDGNPLAMAVQASFTDVATSAQCSLDLSLTQQGPPLLVWGTGCKLVNPTGPTPITQNNYYYSLTNLQATGSLTINGETHEVTGVTWMDHEYGTFPPPSGGASSDIWTLQDLQLANGLHLSNYTNFGILPQANVPMPSNATLLLPGGESVYVETVTTPMNPVSIGGNTYFLKFKVDVIIGGRAHLYFLIESICDNQVFTTSTTSGYEGVAKGDMIVSVDLTRKITREIVVSSGTAWIEQSLGYT